MTIRWITPRLATASAASLRDHSDIAILDVRDLVDKAGNSLAEVRMKIEHGCSLLDAGERVVVSCDYGISRSNSVAIGILARSQGISVDEALRQVLDATGETEIALDPLRVVREAVEGPGPPTTESLRSPVVVTGASGFLGRAVCLELGRHVTVLGPSRAELDLTRGAAELDLLTRRAKVGCIVHLANPRVYTSTAAMGVTLTMLRNVLDVCSSQNIRLVYLSSWEVYSGYRTRSLVASEDLPANPKGPYGETKWLCETLIGHFRRTRGLRCCLLRSSPVYGEGSDRPKFLYSFVEAARRGDTIRCHKYRNGEPALDLLHVDDVVDAVRKVVCLGHVGTLNLGTGVLTSTSDVARLVVSSLKSASPIEQVEIDGDTAGIAMDSGRASAAIDWRATIPFAQGLERFLSAIPSSTVEKS